MDQQKIINICSKIASILSNMDSELEGQKHNFYYPLIFLQKSQAHGIVKRISEQELSTLFIEEFKNTHHDLYYSVETPTLKKYRFKGEFQDLMLANRSDCQSAASDLTIYEKDSSKYKRILNIEFKFKGNLKSIGQDVLKLIGEPLPGVFIHLLENSNSGTFCNIDPEKGLFNKYLRSFNEFIKYWNNDNKFILIVFIVINKRSLIYKRISITDLLNLDSIFMKGVQSCKIEKIGNWNFEKI